MSQLDIPNVFTADRIPTCDNVQPSNEARRFNIDDIYENVTGTHGPWQLFVALLVCLSTSSSIVFPIFANAVPKYRCKLDNKTEELFKSVEFDVSATNVSKQSRRSLSFIEISSLIGPWPSDTAEEIVHNGIYGCRRYSVNYTNYTQRKSLLSSGNDTTELCANGYIYEPWPHQFPDTIVAEWDLVCADAWKGPFSNSMYMVGMMIGYMMGGITGDRLGRKKTIYIASLFEISFGIAVSFSKSYTTYTLVRALLAIACTTKSTPIAVLLVEMTNAKYRSTFGAFCSIYINFFSISLTAILAIFIPNWRHLHLLIMVPSCFGVVILLFLPESPRWFASRGEFSRAAAVLYQTYRMNNCLRKKKHQLLSKEKFLELFPNDVKGERNISNTERRNNCRAICEFGNIGNIFSALVKPYSEGALAKRSILSTGIFACQLCSFLGLMYYTQVIRGSVYIVLIISSISSLPATLIFTVVYRKIMSRRKPLIIISLLSCLTLLIGGFYTTIAQPESELALIICCNLAIVLLGASFNMLFVYVPELFPSVLRTQCFGYATGLGRLGCILSSFINHLDLEVRHGLPIIIYGCVLLIQLILMYCAPESNGRNLDDDVEIETNFGEECGI